APARRRRLGRRGQAGGPVGQDGRAEGVSRARHLRRGPAPLGYGEGADDHRGQLRPRGADLWRRPIRRGRGHVRDRGAARTPVQAVQLGAVTPRPILWHMPVGWQVVWYVLAGVSVLVFAYGLAAPLLRYRSASRAGLPPMGELPGRIWRATRTLYSHAA